MPDAIIGLVGVIVGGIVACIAPIATLILGERRRKREARLASLKAD